MKCVYFEARRWFCYSVSHPENPPYLIDMAHSDDGEIPHPVCDCFPFKKTRKPCVHIRHIQRIEEELLKEYEEKTDETT